MGHIKSWTAELSEEAPPRKPAEMFTVAMVIALELLVVEESEPVFYQGFGMGASCDDLGRHEMR
jgi:hypothetical protein